MAFSINTFAANTYSVELLPALYAAWEGGISASSLSTMRFFMHTARTILFMDRSVIGRRFWTCPFGFPGFCAGIIIPSVNSGGCTLVPDRSCRYQLTVCGENQVQTSTTQLLFDRLLHFYYFAVILLRFLFLPRWMAGSLLLAVNRFCLDLDLFTNLFFKVRCNNFSLFSESKSSCLDFNQERYFWFLTLNFFYYPKHPRRIILTVFISFRRFSNFCLSSSFIFWWIVFMISFWSFWRLFFVVLSVTFLIFSLISGCCLDSRVISSFTWKRCCGFFPRTVSAVSFIAWAIFFH